MFVRCTSATGVLAMANRLILFSVCLRILACIDGSL